MIIMIRSQLKPFHNMSSMHYNMPLRYSKKQDKIWQSPISHFGFNFKITISVSDAIFYKNNSYRPLIGQSFSKNSMWYGSFSN